MKIRDFEKVVKVRKILVLGMVAGLLMGCGNVIPELTEEEASLIATYAADVTLGHTKESASRLIDTAAETARLQELSEKIEKMQKQKAQEEEEEQEQQAQESEQSSGGNGGAEVIQQSTENMADFIGLDGFQVSYDGYEISKSYSVDAEDEWEPAFDATEGKNLLIVKLKVTNISGDLAVADVFSKNMMFSITGDNGMGGMAFVTMLLNDFAFARDEIGAGESRQYVLITQVDEGVTETSSLSLFMKRGGESMNVKLQ